MERDTLVSGSVNELGSDRLELRVGDVLRDTYRIVGPLAKGGNGSVFLATHERLPGRVAVKTLQQERVRDAESLARFRAEAQITSTLRHPNIVQILDYDVTASGCPYLVMELLEGDDLDEVMSAGPVSLARAVPIILQLAGALEFAHAHGVVHRDLKPGNVMLVGSPPTVDLVKIVDFGISKRLAAEGPPLTRPNQVLGTPGYMAPEQIRGQAIDARVDQFALASLTYELLAGRPPFPGHELTEVLHAVMSEDPSPLSTHVEWPAAALSRVVARGLAKSPDERFASVREFAEALQKAIEEDGKPPGTAPPRADGEPEMLDIGRNYHW